MKRTADLLVVDILENISLIEKSIESVKKKDFLLSPDLRDATLRRLEVIGEAVKNMPVSFKEKYSQIPWKRIAGFRDIVIHTYFRIDTDIIWNVIKKDIPPLKQKIIKIKGDLDE